MKIDFSASPEIYAATRAEAKARGLTQSRIIRERLAAAYGIAAHDKPRKIARYIPAVAPPVRQAVTGGEIVKILSPSAFVSVQTLDKVFS